MPMLPDERFGNRTPNTGARPLPPATSPVTPTPITPVVPLPPVPPNPTGGEEGGLNFDPSGGSGGGTEVTSAGVNTLPPDMIGDIPPPPVPAAPITGSGVGGIHGTEAGTFARPGGPGIKPFRTAAYTPKPQQRFGPGVATVGGDTGVQGLGLDPEQAAEILRNRAAGRAF